MDELDENEEFKPRTDPRTLEAIDKSLDLLEFDFRRLRRTVHSIKGEQQVLVIEFGKAKGQLDKVVAFFEGTDKLLGFTKKHWRTLLKFGCGFITAYGVTNPSVQRSLIFIQHFFGL